MMMEGRKVWLDTTEPFPLLLGQSLNLSTLASRRCETIPLSLGLGRKVQAASAVSLHASLDKMNRQEVNATQSGQARKKPSLYNHRLEEKRRGEHR